VLLLPVGVVLQEGEGMAENILSELTIDDCHALLAAHHLGRLAFLDRAGVMPMIIPVNYLFHDETVVFRTDPGSKLLAALHGSPVAFEVDGADEQQHGWSVVVRGFLEEVTDPHELDRLSATPLVAWAPGARAHYVRVDPRLVTGRRIEMQGLPSRWFG
jgi:nitroimidazol reductase NimA-like FMN-containing flavoprotein (pyridoxamine 5'-phosphate oxidase superfamily)